jgi:hypothetical protein
MSDQSCGSTISSQLGRSFKRGGSLRQLFNKHGRCCREVFLQPAGLAGFRCFCGLRLTGLLARLNVQPFVARLKKNYAMQVLAISFPTKQFSSTSL